MGRLQNKGVSMGFAERGLKPCESRNTKRKKGGVKKGRDVWGKVALEEEEKARGKLRDTACENFSRQGVSAR